MYSFFYTELNFNLLQGFHTFMYLTHSFFIQHAFNDLLCVQICSLRLFILKDQKAFQTT